MNQMKRLMSQFFKERIFCGLDIGSQKIKACLSRVHDAENLELLAVNEADTRGLLDRSVNDIAEFSSVIGSVCEGLTKKTKVRFHDLYLGIGGDLVETRMSRAVIPLTERGNKVIVPSDVRAARHQARLLGVRLDEEVICDLVRQFKVDDVNIANNPVGLYGRKIEVETLLVVVNVTRLRNITKAIRQAGYEVNHIFYNGEVLAEAALDKRHRVDGSVLVDFGAKKTAILVFKEGLLKHFSFAFFGGDTMTRRIAEKMTIPFDLAEDVKKTYVRLSEKPALAEGDEVLIKKDQGFVPVRRSVITGIIDEDVNQFIEHIRDAIAASGYEGQIKSGIVMAGGGSLLTGLMERVETSIGLPVTMARNIPGLNNSSLYSMATSLAEAGYKGSLRYIFDTRKPKDWFDALKARATEFCNEYF
ncbi:MAG: cell division protein FtsA [Candidatus Omnitrophica bacterium]|nr:cell division protein FtsA [Candidatus Omnitrophota bacterium]